ncbi:MAG: TIGR00730 family Rossman fold protein [Chitinophagaceae bacterium]|nr:TIGR00730 family Rossman fold protein [Chitinophagaceae bacterium]MCB9045078.1 TIGR00730 family Rossman fold protein [Chitinophagales bacterium]
MKSIAVFCGSGDGYNDIYREEAYQVGRQLAERGIEVVYGAARIGIMGAVADGVLSNNGKITGIIPGFLQTKEIAHDGLTELIVVETMHERKLKMYDKCDGVLVLPGGWGTMDEMFEMLTWGQLGMHSKPIGLLNINGYYDPLKAMNSTMVQEGFLDECTRSILMFSQSLTELLDKMDSYEGHDRPQVIDKQTT